VRSENVLSIGAWSWGVFPSQHVVDAFTNLEFPQTPSFRGFYGGPII